MEKQFVTYEIAVKLKKVEITNEIKAKVYSQYIGHFIHIEDSGMFKLKGCVGESIYTLAGRNNLSVHEMGNHKMVLKPLSKITDEHANEVAKILDVGMIMGQLKKWVLGAFKNEFSHKTLSSVFAYQYLQSQGYDLPHILLGKKTLHEAGLAIYE